MDIMQHWLDFYILLCSRVCRLYPEITVSPSDGDERLVFMIHKYKLCGFNIVLDVNSGAVHIVDELTYDMLESVEPPFEEKCPEKIANKLSKFYEREDIESCYQELKELYNDQILFADDDYEKYAKYSVASPVKAMCLNIAHDCNLACCYCFAEEGEYHGRRALMSYETGKQALDFLIAREAAGTK